MINITKKSIYTLGVLAFLGVASSTVKAQDYSGKVGINTESPKATLDIKAKIADGSQVEGLKTPQLTGDALKTMTAQLTADNDGLVVFVTSAVTTPDASTTAVTLPGYYRFNFTAQNPISVSQGKSFYAAKSWVRLEPTGLEVIKEGNKIGRRLVGTNSERYGNIGDAAIDMSFQNQGTTDGGATGDYSFAIGAATKATATRSFAGGQQTTASGNNSFAGGGYNNTASGENSFVVGGNNNTASGHSSVAFGATTKAIGNRSFAGGQETTARGNNSVAIGYQTTASGADSFAGGHTATASGTRSFAFGDSVKATASNSVAFGVETEAGANKAVAFGSGTKALAENSAVFGDGTVVQGTESKNSFIAGGVSSKIINSPNSLTYGANIQINNSLNSFAGGAGTRIDNSASSVALGNQVTLKGNGAIALGSYTTVNGDGSVAIGIDAKVGMHPNAKNRDDANFVATPLEVAGGVAIGAATVTGNNGVAIGNGASAGTNEVAIGGSGSSVILGKLKPETIAVDGACIENGRLSYNGTDFLGCTSGKWVKLNN